MKIYIAAPWISKQCAGKAGDMFEEAGHEITEKWWLHPESEDPAELSRQADRDLVGVHACKLFVLLNTSKSEGKAVELGYALALQHENDMPWDIPRIVAVGKPSNVFHYLKEVEWFPTVQEVIDAITRRR